MKGNSPYRMMGKWEVLREADDDEEQEDETDGEEKED